MFSKNSTPAPKSGSKSSANAPSAPTARAPIPGAPASRSPSVPSILGRDLIITGDINTDGEVQIDGRLDGNVTATVITIGESGAVNGHIEAGQILVRGKVTGRIEANTVDLAETANVTADIVQDQLTIANGAFFDGKCSRKTLSPAPMEVGATVKSKKSA